MLQETDGEVRRLGTYHTGIETKVVGLRMPVEKIEAVRAVFEKQGLIAMQDSALVITDAGRLVARALVMPFDNHRDPTAGERFSRII